MAMTNCSECGKEISDKATTCPHCGAPQSAPSQPALCQNCGKEVAHNTPICPHCKRVLNVSGDKCPKCNIPYITTQKDAAFSAIFFISVPLFIIGLVLLLFNWLAALLVIALAFIIDYVGRKKKTVLICPKCRFEPY